MNNRLYVMTALALKPKYWGDDKASYLAGLRTDAELLIDAANESPDDAHKAIKLHTKYKADLALLPDDAT